jgi:hypothetical protein
MENGEMTGVATAMADFAGLAVKFEGHRWEFVLRRDDFAPEPRFGELHLKPIRALDVAAFLPHWDSLAWVPVPDNLLSRVECWARDWPYQINLRARAGSPLQHRDVIEAFRGFMAQAAA